MKRKIFASVCLLLVLAACTAAQTAQPAANVNPTDPPNNPAPSATFTIVPPTNTQVPTQTYTPTSTLGQQIIILTHETPDLMLTSANLQLGQNYLELTAAANQIATLQAQAYSLQTQVAQAATAAASGSTSGSSSGSSSSSGSYNNASIKLPAGVYTASTTAKAVVYFTKRDNDAGYPIMEIYEPRVKFEPGSTVWVYEDVIRADGADYFYEAYDPDGQTTIKAYFRLQDIQIRLPSGSPNPNNYPSTAAKAEFKDKCVAHYARKYDQGNKPIMEVVEPRIKYESGSHEILITQFVVATGGSHWYPIYDPDGKPSTYIRDYCVKFLYIWD